VQFVSLPPPSVGIGNGLDDWGIGVQFSSRCKHFVHLCRASEVWGLPSLVSSGHWSVFPGGNVWLGPEPDHSALSSAEDKDGWSCVYLHSSIYIDSAVLG
jgi:hypothetical protein